jgi:dolichyl-phosphate beta-glucosyltransferase
LVVPLFNEQERVRGCLTQLAPFVSARSGELVFVDDGSTDGTTGILDRMVPDLPDTTVRVLRRAHRGKGAALAAGIQASGGIHVGFCDVDLATSLPDLDLLLDAARSEGVLAIGSRALPDSRILVHEAGLRELLGKTYNWLLQRRLTPGIQDTQCGAKFAPREVWTRILRNCVEPGFAWDVEVVAMALALDVGVREIPVTWTHDTRSRVRVVRDGIRMLTSLVGIHRRVAAVRRARAGSRALEDDGHVVLVDEAPIVE